MEERKATELTRSFECIVRLRIRAVLIRHSRQKAIIALHRLQARIEQQECTGSIRILRLTILEALVAHERGLLVTCDTRDGNALEDASRDMAVDLGRRGDLGKDGWPDAEELEHCRGPLEGADIHEECTRGVGHVDGMNSS